MYRSIQDFLNTWEYEREATLKIFRALTDSSLLQKVTEQGRSIGFLAWHITVTLGEMGGKAGLPVEAPMEDSPAPQKASEISDAYDKASLSLGSAAEKEGQIKGVVENQIFGHEEFDINYFELNNYVVAWCNKSQW